MNTTVDELIAGLEERRRALPPKLCRDCKHHQFDLAHGGDVCVRPQMDLVLGGTVDRPMPLGCYHERMHVGRLAACGYEARFFEAKS